MINDLECLFLATDFEIFVTKLACVVAFTEITLRFTCNLLIM